MCSPAAVKTRVMPTFCAITPERMVPRPLPYSLISTSTPAARSSFMSASTVCGVGSTMSRRRLCVRISNCSRLFLSTCGERLTVNFSMRVGSGMGPRTCAPVRFAVFTISRVDESRIRWSNALRRMRMFWPFIAVVSLGEWRVANSEWLYPFTTRHSLFASLLDDGCDDAGADGATAFPNRKTQLFLHRDRHDQVHFHC